jgi:hypothetical protein
MLAALASLKSAMGLSAGRQSSEAKPTQHLERVVLKLHSSYFASELCRPALKPMADLSFYHDLLDAVFVCLYTFHAYLRVWAQHANADNL